MVMWKSIYCFLIGKHEYTVTCAPGQIFLRCRNCGQRSSGWAVQKQAVLKAPVKTLATVPALRAKQRAA
jgi:hypothetical protein